LIIISSYVRQAGNVFTLWTGLRKKCSTEFCKIRWKDGRWAKEETIRRITLRYRVNLTVTVR